MRLQIRKVVEPRALAIPSVFPATSTSISALMYGSCPDPTAPSSSSLAPMMTLSQAFLIHGEQLALFGGPAGLRDEEHETQR